MPRKYARTKLSINDDPDFEDLSTEAQWLYQRVMMTDDTLSACGVMDWRPKRLLRKSRTITLKKILDAAAELERTRFALFDLETEEALIRTYVRHDEPLRNPRNAAAVVSAYRAACSPELRAAVVTEVIRDHAENPDYSSWTHKDTEKDLARLMSRPDAAQVGYTHAYADLVTDENPTPVADRIGYPDSVPNTDTDPVDNGDADPVQNADTESVHNGVPVRSETVSDIPVDDTDPNRSETYLPPTTYHQPPPRGQLTGERHQGSEPDSIDSLPIGCAKHPNNDGPRCHDCRRAREDREAFEAKAARLQAEQRVAERIAANDAARRAIETCPLGCAERDGYRPNRQVCDHDPDTEDRARRGSAAVRAALAEAQAEKADRAAMSESEPAEPATAQEAADAPAPETDAHTEEIRAHV